MDLETSVEIACPAAEAFAAISDFSRNPEWQSGMKSATWTSSPPLTVGSTYDQVARFLGRDVVTSFEVTAYDPGRSVTIESRASSFPIVVTRSVDSLGDDRCRVVARVAGQPGGFFRVVSSVVDRMAARSVRSDYQRLRQLLENG